MPTYHSTTATAIFNSKLNSVIGPNVAAAVVPLGLPPAELPAFIGALASGNIPAALKLPGVTPEMLQAGGAALLSTFAYAFKYVWVFAACISAVGFVGKSSFRQNITGLRQRHACPQLVSLSETIVANTM
jgi:hypothetical protein